MSGCVRFATLVSPVTALYSFVPFATACNAPHRHASCSTQSGSMSSILSLLLSTTQSKSELVLTEKCSFVAPSGMSHIKYIPSTKRAFSVSTITLLTIRPPSSANTAPTRLLPNTDGNLTRL